MLIQKKLDGTIVNKVDKAIERLRGYEPEEGYYLAFSGGKDSVVIDALAKMSGVKYEKHHQLTTIDPPELFYFIREHHKDSIINRPEKPFLVEMVKRGFPLRMKRWCCEYLKEKKGDNRYVVTGIRWAESARRAKRMMFERCVKSNTKHYLHPIIDWSDDEVWEFIREYNVPYCKLYDEGFKRIGCLFCPMSTPLSRKKELKKYPGYERAFRKAFRKLYDKKKSEGKTSVDRWKDGDEMFDYWIGKNRGGYNKDQLVLPVFEN